jgi:hypothetical protein
MLLLKQVSAQKARKARISPHLVLDAPPEMA